MSPSCNTRSGKSRFVQAVMETKRDGLMEKIQIAEKAISERLRELEDGGGWEERVALRDAGSTLRTLKKVLIQQSPTA